MLIPRAVNIDALPQFIAANRQNYYAYADALAVIDGLTLLAYDEASSPNYQYVVLEVGPTFAVGRDDLVTALRAENILARQYFRPGCHRMQPYRELFPHAGLMLQGTLDVANRVVVLPNGAAAAGGIETIVGVVHVLGESGA